MGGLLESLDEREARNSYIVKKVDTERAAHAVRARAPALPVLGCLFRPHHFLGKAGRTVWFNFWDTNLTYERSYWARLNYVHQNPVKHGLVSMANQYPWCSAAWFERTASPATVKTIYGFKTDNLAIYDEFQQLR